jgi:7,8-dihydropterin-6-yl-methyl-4-(beta-D-ribofuranosyl)aminobenzene 5'-phosphate synthase
MFAEGGTRQPDGGVLPAALVPSPEELAQSGALPEVTKAPQELLDGMFYLSGEIPRVTSYETGLQNHVRRNAQGDWQADPLIMDERFLAVAVKGKGVVVFTACSHAGVVNVLTHARECFPDQKLYAVMGGFHLSGETERCIPETVRDIAGFDLTVIAPGHCTGWRALNRLVQTCGEGTVTPLAVGKILAF